MICKICLKDKKLDEFVSDGCGGKRKVCKICYNRRTRELRDIDRNNNRQLIRCKVCGRYFRFINNTHLKRHGMTIKEYKKRYSSEVFTDDLLVEQKEEREKTINRRYTKDEIKYLKGIKSVKSKEKKYGKSISEISKDGWNKISDDIKEEILKKSKNSLKTTYRLLKRDYYEYQEHKRNKLKKRKETNLSKYGVEFTQQLEEVKKKVLETKRKKYGKSLNNWKKYFDTMYKTWFGLCI